MVGHQSDMWLLISDRLARPDLVDVGELGGQAGGGGNAAGAHLSAMVGQSLLLHGQVRLLVEQLLDAADRGGGRQAVGPDAHVLVANRHPGQPRN